MKIKNNVLVHVDYRLSDTNNNHLNPDENELIYLHGGHGHVFKDFEDALEGKEAGECFKVTLTPEQAFGEYQEELIVKEPLSELPQNIYIGMELDSDDDSDTIYVVTNIQDEYALLNANHPLAGLTLTFEGTITELQELSDKEVQELLEFERHNHHD